MDTRFSLKQMFLSSETSAAVKMESPSQSSQNTPWHNITYVDNSSNGMLNIQQGIWDTSSLQQRTETMNTANNTITMYRPGGSTNNALSFAQTRPTDYNIVVTVEGVPTEHLPQQSNLTQSQHSQQQSLIVTSQDSEQPVTVQESESNEKPTQSSIPKVMTTLKKGVKKKVVKKNEEHRVNQSEPSILPGIVKKNKFSNMVAAGFDPTKLEENAEQVRVRFDCGCDCQDQNCFKNLNPDYVYRHRLNIAELTKSEHDMYLMGVTMACISNPEETIRHKERKRLRTRYVFQGQEVCLEAFLYLENCTHYQLKRIRKHVTTHGVTPRIHGNHGKKPHNMFSLDIYQHATAFLHHYSKQFGNQVSGNQLSKLPKSKFNKPAPIFLPQDVTRKKIHSAYREYCETFEPAVKLMGYSTFRHFMKEQFPHLRFPKIDINKTSSCNASSNVTASGISEMTSTTSPTVGPLTQQPGTILQQLSIPVVAVAADGSTREIQTEQSTAYRPNQPTFVVAAPLSRITLQPAETGNFSTCHIQQLATLYQPTTMTLSAVSGAPNTFSFTSL